MSNKYKEYTDEKLMGLVGKNDKFAFDILYQRYATAMLNYFYRMLGRDTEKAEDFMQDIFVKIIKKNHLYRSDRKFKTWLYSVANNMCKNEYRKLEVRSNTSNIIDENMVKYSDTEKADEQYDNKVFNEKLYEELDKLKSEQKETFVMRYMQDLSIKEIAEHYKCSEGTVKSRLFYTLKKLANQLKEYNPRLASIMIVLMQLLIQ